MKWFVPSLLPSLVPGGYEMLDWSPPPHVQYSWKSWGLVISGGPPCPFLAPPVAPPPPLWLPFASGAPKLVWRRKRDPNPRRLFDSSEFLEKTILKLCVHVFFGDLCLGVILSAPHLQIRRSAWMSTRTPVWDQIRLWQVWLDWCFTLGETNLQQQGRDVD